MGHKSAVTGHGVRMCVYVKCDFGRDRANSCFNCRLSSSLE